MLNFEKECQSKAQDQKQPPLFNYICRAWTSIDQKCEMEDIYVMKGLDPKIKDIYSNTVNMFCFPYPQNEIPIGEFFSYCLTDADKNYSYCFCYVSGSIVQIKELNQARKYTVFALFTSFFHPHLCSEIIFKVATLFSDKREACNSFIKHCSKIEFEKTKYDYCISTAQRTWTFQQDPDISYELTRFNMLKPENEIVLALQYMFSNFSPYHLLSAIVAMMNDYRIIVLSSKAKTLGQTCFNLLSLIYPLKWPGTFIPILPSKLIDFLDSPIAYIDGVHSSMAHYLYAQDGGSNFVINCDFHDAALASIPDFPECVEAIIDRTAQDIKKKINNFQGNLFPALEIQMTLQQFISKIYGAVFEVSQEISNLDSNSASSSEVGLNSCGSDTSDVVNPEDLYNKYIELRMIPEQEFKFMMSQTQFTLQFFQKTIESNDDSIFNLFFPTFKKSDLHVHIEKENIPQTPQTIQYVYIPQVYVPRKSVILNQESAEKVKSEIENAKSQSESTEEASNDK